MDKNELIKLQRYEQNLFFDLKPLIPYLENKNVTDIFVLGSGAIKIAVFEKGVRYVEETLTTEQRLRIIYAIASILDKPINVTELPKLEVVIPKYNARFTAMLPPWVQQPEFTIRRPPEKIYSLENYVENGQMTNEQYIQLVDGIRERKNLLIGGATGSGKTTFLNAVLMKMCELTPDERFLIIEDTPELRCEAKDATFACGKPLEVIEIVRLAMRWSMNRIIFGELRFGAVANELIKIWATGHTGNATTIHAGSAGEMLVRLNGLLREVILGELPNLSDSIGLCIHLVRHGGKPKVNEILDLQNSAVCEYAELLQKK